MQSLLSSSAHLDSSLNFLCADDWSLKFSQAIPALSSSKRINIKNVCKEVTNVLCKYAKY